MKSETRLLMVSIILTFLLLTVFTVTSSQSSERGAGVDSLANISNIEDASIFGTVLPILITISIVVVVKIFTQPTSCEEER